MFITSDIKTFCIVVHKTMRTIREGIAMTAHAIFIFQEFRTFLRVSLQLIERINTHLSTGETGTAAKGTVNLILRNNKSGGLCALRYRFSIIQFCDLFGFGREEEAQLSKAVCVGYAVISSAITVSSACAFSMFMCCTHAICCVFLSGAGFCCIS